MAVLMSAATKYFIQRARITHGKKYSYAKSIYVQARQKLTITCKKHGDFTQTADSHLRGTGCPGCAIDRRTAIRCMNTKDFVSKARKIHGEKYDYRSVRYTRSADKVTIICPKHGKWRQTPNNHLHGFGCEKCGKDRLRIAFADDLVSFVKKARKIHGEKFEYPSQYVNQNTPIEIKCAIHGIFIQRPTTHIKSSFGCPKCALDNPIKATLLSHEQFVQKAKKVHGSKYSYPDRYKKSLQHIQIKCPKHGLFKQTPNNHLHGHGCKFCQAEDAAARVRLSHDQFLKRARKIHGNKFEYPETYHASIRPIAIVCPTHGRFKQTPNTHLGGAGCPKCMESLGERRIARMLEVLKINHESQKKFSDCVDKRPLRFDFWLPDFNVLIEYDGPQHFESKEYFGGKSNFESTIRRDRIKSCYAQKKKIRLIRVKYTETKVERFLACALGISIDEKSLRWRGRKQ
jgi:Zn finger protein HypA/HybF involved in hydrogenase expression